CIEVILVRGVIRVLFAVDLGMPHLAERRQCQQHLILVCKVPVPTFDDLEVPCLDPPLPLVGVSAAGPAPQCLPDMVITLCVGTRRHLASVIVGSTPNDRVQSVYHVSLSGG